MKLLKPTVLALACSCIALSGCGSEQTGEASSNNSSANSTGNSGASSPAWVLTSAPSEWREIGEAKRVAAEGEEIVLRGRIGGRANPITEGSPVFIMMDAAIPSCADKEDDHCSIPWDYCCETKETIAANSATVIVVDVDGNPIGSGLDGLKPLDEVIVVGTVDVRPNDSVLTIKATGIHKKSAG